MSKTSILLIGIIMIISVASMSIVIPQLMVRNVAKRVSKYKIQKGIPIDTFEVTVEGKRCKSFDEGRCKSIKKADDCEMLFSFKNDGTERYIMVPYGVYLQVKEGTKGILSVQNGEYRNFKEEIITNKQ